MRVSHAGILQPLLLKDRHGDLGQVVHDDVVQRAAGEQVRQSVVTIPPEAKRSANPYRLHTIASVSRIEPLSHRVFELLEHEAGLPDSESELFVKRSQPALSLSIAQ